MKKSFLFLTAACMFIMTATSCSSDNDNDNNNNNNNAAEVQQITNDMESGTWRITSYIDSGQDETHHFTGYDFTFNTNGTVTATDGNNVVNGTWSVTDSSNSNDDSSSDDDIDFNLMFGSPADFMELNDDWDIVTHSSTMIDLIDVSGGNGGTDTLTFEKN